jgi:hypothetical protein
MLAQSLGSLPLLQLLALQFNRLTGTIPASLGSLVRLNQLCVIE